MQLCIYQHLAIITIISLTTTHCRLHLKLLHAQACRLGKKLTTPQNEDCTKSMREVIWIDLELGGRYEFYQIVTPDTLVINIDDALNNRLHTICDLTIRGGLLKLKEVGFPIGWLKNVHSILLIKCVGVHATRNKCPRSPWYGPSPTFLAWRPMLPAKKKSC